MAPLAGCVLIFSFSLSLGLDKKALVAANAWLRVCVCAQTDTFEKRLMNVRILEMGIFGKSFRGLFEGLESSSQLDSVLETGGFNESSEKLNTSRRVNSARLGLDSRKPNNNEHRPLSSLLLPLL